MTSRKRVVFVVNPPEFFLSHRAELARRAQARGYAVSVVTPAPGKMIVSAGFDWHPMPFDPGGKNPLHDLRTLLALVRLFRRLQPAIVHNVTVKPVLYGTLAARIAGVPRVVNAISGLGYLFTGRRRWRARFGKLLYRLLMRHPDMRVIVQNREDRDFFLHNRLAQPQTIRLIRGSGVDTALFVPHAPPSGPPIVLQTSRMIADKGVREFIAAARLLKPDWPTVRFQLVGPLYPGNPSALTAEELREAEASGAVEWLGHRDDIPQLLAKASVFCLASYREGLPKSVLEAAASGLPIVTTNTSGCREVVTDGENGLLVPVADAPALAAAIARLLGDAAMARQLGAQARTDAEREFALDINIEQQLALYAEQPLRDPARSRL